MNHHVVVMCARVRQAEVIYPNDERSFLSLGGIRKQERSNSAPHRSIGGCMSKEADVRRRT